MPRQKTVGDKDWVAHQWAHALQDEARNAQRNFFFRDKVIYSYGSHFPMAQRVRGGLFLVTIRHYSITTSCHLSNVRQAIPHNAKRFEVLYADARTADEHVHNVKDYLARILSARGKVSVSRKLDTKNYWHRRAISLANEVREYANEFKVAKRCPELKKLRDLDAYAKEHEEALRKSEELEKRKRIAAEKKALADAKKAIEKWIHGGAAPIPRCIGQAFLRVKPVNWRAGEQTTAEKILETSLGVEVPLEDAHKAYRFVALCREKGEDWRCNGSRIPVGDFQLDSITKNGDVVAGCHRIQWSEIERFAATVGWEKEV